VVGGGLEPGERKEKRRRRKNALSPPTIAEMFSGVK